LVRDLQLLLGVAMAKRILVPLDGSELAERALPLVADLARGAGATMRLLHVMPVTGNVLGKDGQLVAYADQEMQRLEAEALLHLRSVVAQLDRPAECVVRFGENAEEILREGDAFGADLIVVTTAGKSGLKRTVLGSVAEQVFHRARVPVLLYHPGPIVATAA
jgi:nucleotide-binding universal stress UspA family protein